MMSCLGGALLSLLKSGLLSLSVFFTYMYMNNLASTHNHLPLTQLSEPLFSTRPTAREQLPRIFLSNVNSDFRWSGVICCN
jgi:hypothetical protein